jgi:dipeptidyl aminopeptidase/acylaminoacyl peptidase
VQWDGTTLNVADVVEHPRGLLPHLGEPRAVAGGADVAIFQGEFLPDGRMLYVSDETGWARLAVHDLKTNQRRWLTPEGVEVSLPAWSQDRRTYAASGDGKFAIALFNENANHRLVWIDLKSDQIGQSQELRQYTAVDQVVASPTAASFAFIGSAARTPSRVLLHDFAAEKTRVMARASGETISPDALAPAEPISWPTAGGEMCHGLYFPPTSTRCTGTGKPPLVVWVHGGPTGQVFAAWRAEIQFLATRGFAVLAVNYRGSTGYGREYMLKLRGNWGICDVEDSISGKQHLVHTGRVDPQRTVIMGGSAGGFTVLQTMAMHPEEFTAGVCLYGVANQFHLASMTHKFEARYLDTIIGPLPEAAELYRQRSPINFADRIRRPLAIFQGADDR